MLRGKARLYARLAPIEYEGWNVFQPHRSSQSFLQLEDAKFVSSFMQFHTWYSSSSNIAS